MNTLTLTVDAFFDRFKPLPNHLRGLAADWDGCMFETYGSDLDYVSLYLQQYPDRVWTLLITDGDITITNGFHYVNRIGYLLTEEPCPADTFIEAVDPDSPPGEPPHGN